MRVRRVAPVVATLAAGGLLQLGMPRAAEPLADFESPFGCGQGWYGSTRAGHSPSEYSVDFNRDGDEGDLTVSSAPGVVDRVGDTGGTSYGRYVVVDHGDGESTVFAHLDVVHVVAGQAVDQGTWIGLVGDTGGVSGPHLHFEERQDYVDRAPYFHGSAFAMNTTLRSENCGDVPVAGDWDGDGDEEVGTFRRTRGGTFRLLTDGGTRVLAAGSGTDQPVTGDWNGDGRADVGVRSLDRWTLVRPGAVRRVDFGRPRGTAVAGDWDGDGRDQLGVWYPGTRSWLLRTRSGEVGVRFGARGAQPLVGDWDGDGVDDLGAFSPATGTVALRTVTDGVESRTAVDFGAPDSLVVAGDWDGDRRSDLATWKPSTARWVLRTAAPDDPTMARATTSAFRFGHRR